MKVYIAVRVQTVRTPMYVSYIHMWDPIQPKSVVVQTNLFIYIWLGWPASRKNAKPILFC